MEEYFDVINENGCKTGKTKLRELVHRDGDWHKGVHVWIFDQNGDILLQKRSANKKSNPNKYSISCAGHLSAGEESVIGALRELKEELNISTSPEELRFIKTIKTPSKSSAGFVNNEFNDLYVLQINSKNHDIKYQEDEISEIKFVPYKVFKEMVKQNNSDLVLYNGECELIFNLFDSIFDK